MKWHEHPLLYKHSAQIAGVTERAGGAVQVVNEITDMLNKRGLLKPESGLISEVFNMLEEASWVDARRPYYNIWPSVGEAFTRVDLRKVQCSNFFPPLPQLLLRFAEGHEVSGIRTILMARTMSRVKGVDFRSVLLLVNCGRTRVIDREEQPVILHTVVKVEDGTTIGEQFDDAAQHDKALLEKNPIFSTEALNDDEKRIIATAMRIAVAVCILGDNPDLIEASPLEADREKWERTHDPKYIAKAARRGKIGWDIGRHIEAAPGYRNPHFAIRWMGHGENKSPVLRPIKGCLVRRKQIMDVPTDWMDGKPAELIPERTEL